MVKKITMKRLENIALYYLERYESCSGKLRTVLNRRILKTKLQDGEVDENAGLWVEEIIQKMQDLGYLNDKRYAQNTLRRLMNAGKSIRYICGKLKQDGIESDLIEGLLENENKSSGELDLVAAQRLVKKKKLGFYRPQNLRVEMYNKDLAVLGRAGFSYEIASNALKEDSTA